MSEVVDLRGENEADLLARVRPQLEKLEVIRLDRLKNYRWRKRIAVPVAAVGTPILGYIDWWLLMLQRGDDGGAGLTIAFLGALWYWVTMPKRQYARAYKTDILPHIARALGNLTYNIGGKIPMDML